MGSSFVPPNNDPIEVSNLEERATRIILQSVDANSGEISMLSQLQAYEGGLPRIHPTSKAEVLKEWQKLRNSGKLRGMSQEELDEIGELLLKIW